MERVYKIRLKKGDKIIVRSGKFKGQSGTITATHPSLNKVTVEGINIVKKNIKPTRTNPKGGIIQITKPLWASKVGIVNPDNKTKPSRIGYKFDTKGQKQRVYQSSRKEIK